MSDKLLASISFSSFSCDSPPLFLNQRLFLCFLSLGDSFCCFYVLHWSALSPCLHGVAFWGRSPVGFSDAFSLMSLAWCLRNGLCSLCSLCGLSWCIWVLIVIGPLVRVCSPLAGWLKVSTLVTSCILSGIGDDKTKQHRKQNPHSKKYSQQQQQYQWQMKIYY